MRHAHLTLLAFAFALAAPANAHAHGGDPFTRDVLETPAGEHLILTNFGIVRASDPTHYVCEEAFSGSNDFLIEVLGPNQWVLASRYTISRTDDLSLIHI